MSESRWKETLPIYSLYFIGVATICICSWYYLPRGKYAAGICVLLGVSTFIASRKAAHWVSRSYSVTGELRSAQKVPVMGKPKSITIIKDEPKARQVRGAAALHGHLDLDKLHRYYDSISD